MRTRFRFSRCLRRYHLCRLFCLSVHLGRERRLCRLFRLLPAATVFTGSAVFAVFACGTGIAFFTLFALRALRARCAGIALVTLIAFVALFALFALDCLEPLFVCSGRIAVRFGVGGVERVCLTEGVVGVSALSLSQPTNAVVAAAAAARD